MSALLFGTVAVVLFFWRREAGELLCSFWSWYRRVTGYEKALLQRSTGLRIRSTCSEVKGPRRRDVIEEIMGRASR